MWSDNDVDNAFQRLNPPEPEPTPFPLDAWLRLEDQLDRAVIERAVRRRLWQFFAAEVAVVLLAALAWLAWPTAITKLVGTELKSASATHTAARQSPVRQAAAQPVNPAVDHQATAGISPPNRATSAAITAAATAADAAKTVSPVSSHQPASASNLPAAMPSALRSAQGLPVVAAASGQSGRHLARYKMDLQRIATQSNVEANNKHSQNQQEQAARTTLPAARLAASRVSPTAHRSARHLAAGNIAAPTEASTQAVVAATARLRQHREGQSPLLARPAGRIDAMPESDTELTPAAATEGASAASISMAALPLATATLLLPAEAALPSALVPTEAGPPNLPVPVHQPRFYVGLVAAPDVSTVGFFSMAKPLPNVGVVLEYRLTNRLRVSTGLLRSSKEYVARREDYDWGAYQARVYSHDFKDVDGTCIILDVPLNLRYDLVARPQYRVFGSAGLSSYFMQREHYYYDWTDYSGFHAWNGYAVNQNQHLLSILNLSLGFERSLGPHWSVQAESYAKLPLTGVGLGKVRLTSGGVFFAVKYGF